MIELRSGSATDVGRVRSVNEDMALERPNLCAVADGMGGHVGGEVAARMAVEMLEAAFSRAPTRDGLRDAVVRGQCGGLAREPGSPRPPWDGNNVDRPSRGGHPERTWHPCPGQRG